MNFSRELQNIYNRAKSLIDQETPQKVLSKEIFEVLEALPVDLNETEIFPIVLDSNLADYLLAKDIPSSPIQFGPVPAPTMPEPLNFPDLIQMPNPPPKNRVRRGTNSPVFLPPDTSPDNILDIIPKIDLLTPVDIYVGDELVVENVVPSQILPEDITISSPQEIGRYYHEIKRKKNNHDISEYGCKS